MQRRSLVRLELRERLEDRAVLVGLLVLVVLVVLMGLWVRAVRCLLVLLGFLGLRGRLFLLEVRVGRQLLVVLVDPFRSGPAPGGGALDR